MRVTRHAYEVAGWGVGELWVGDGRVVVAHDPPTQAASRPETAPKGIPGAPTETLAGIAAREATGLAPHQYLIQIRVERARQLLAEGAVPSLAAAMTGFADQSHLTYHFKKHLGITPGKYRRCVAAR